MTFDHDISKILGVVPQPKPVPTPTTSVSASAPARPEPLYRYTIDVSRTEYGSITVDATDKAHARDIAWGEVIEWTDYSDDVEYNDVQRDDDAPTNQDELDEWDAEYGNKYTEYGEPMCSSCCESYEEDELTEDKQTSSAWYCCHCAP